MKEDFEFVYGKNSALEIVENSNLQVNKIWLSNSLQNEDLKKTIISYAKEKKIPYNLVPFEKITKLVNNKNHQGVLLSISPIKYTSVESIIESAQKSNVILIAHEIQDAHNLGAMIRTFVAASGIGIILTGRTNIGINSTVMKTSAGALFQANFARATNCVTVLEKLKENNFWIVGTDSSHNFKSLYEVDFPKKVAIVVGNEHEGLGQLIKKNCDFLVRIPISNKVDSLNVSVAFGIVLFEILRKG